MQTANKTNFQRIKVLNKKVYKNRVPMMTIKSISTSTKVALNWYFLYHFFKYTELNAPWKTKNKRIKSAFRHPFKMGK